MGARLSAGASLHLGVVADFDGRRGLGTVTEAVAPAAGDGPDRVPASYPFHSTAIADGTRRIEPGTPVAFVVVASHGGGLEAGELHAVPAAAGPRS